MRATRRSPTPATPTGASTPAATASARPSFAEAFETVVALHAANWSDGGRSEKQWRSSMATYVLPSLGAKSVAEVTAGDILAVLTPLWATKAETARRLKGRLSAVLRWAVAQQYRPDDPTAAVAAALPSNNGHRGHFAALAHSDIPAALATIDASAAQAATKLVIRFLALTATRSSEARGATWSEIDTNTATWAIPAARTKTRKPHRVPLSTQALAVLAEARQLAHSGDLIFPGPTGRALSSEALSKLFRELAISGTPHGAALQLPQLGRRDRRRPRTRRSRPRPHRPRRRRRLPTQRPPPPPPPPHATLGRPVHLNRPGFCGGSGVPRVSRGQFGRSQAMAVTGRRADPERGSSTPTSGTEHSNRTRRKLSKNPDPGQGVVVRAEDSGYRRVANLDIVKRRPCGGDAVRRRIPHWRTCGLRSLCGWEPIGRPAMSVR